MGLGALLQPAIPESGRLLQHHIGLFGGAFDPPHNAHCLLARSAIAELGLDRLHVVPTGHAWHKERALTAAVHRLAMCQLAFADLARTRVDERELRRAGPSYTADTLHELHAENPDAVLHVLIGTDQALAFRSWHRAAEILQLAVVVIAVRAPAAADAAPAFNSADPLPGFAAGAVRVRLLHMAPMALSATDVRRRVARGAPIADCTPAPVAAYIAHHHLYQTNA